MDNVSSDNSRCYGSGERMHATVAVRNSPRLQRTLPQTHGIKSVRRAALEKVAISLLGHPASAGEMALPGAMRTIRFLRRIDVQNDLCGVSPICTVGFSVEEAQIGDCMAFIVSGQNADGGRVIVDRRVEGWRLQSNLLGRIGFPKR